jgi:hypothetical protein
MGYHTFPRGSLTRLRIIAIMLGRLRMTIGECKVAYRKFAEDIFGVSPFGIVWRGLTTFISGKEDALVLYTFKPKRLAKVINDFLVNDLGLRPDEPLIPGRSPTQTHCNVWVTPEKQPSSSEADIL